MRKPEHQTLERLAYEAWLGRGQPRGTPDVDWAAACKSLAAQQSDPQQSDQESPSSSPGSTPTDLGADLVPEHSHDQPRKSLDS